MGLLVGVDEVFRMETGEGRREEEAKEIGKEKIKEVVLKLREERAMGGDGIPNEAWKCGGEGALEMAWEICGRV